MEPLIFFYPRNMPADDFKFADDKEDEAYKSDQFLSPEEKLDLVEAESDLKQKSISVQDYCQSEIPAKYSGAKAEFDIPVYNGQYFPSGDYFYCTTQEDIFIYDASSIWEWELVNSFTGREVRWTITDVDISLDENYIVYSSLGPIVGIVKLNDASQGFQNASHKSVVIDRSTADFSVFSCKFSGSAEEILVGTRNMALEIFDLVKEKKKYRVSRAHEDDINSACFDTKGSQVIYSGSDDSLIKIWDRRINSVVPQGILIGHREGLTNVCSKGDGIHLISNGKDQCTKLWDIRRLKSVDACKDFRKSHRYNMGFDYRFGIYPLANYTKKLAEDESLMTFRGHSVMNTLIRCYFSPMYSTAQRYVVTGCARGRVLVYDTYTGKKAAELSSRGSFNGVCRDVAWHPFRPVIAASSHDCFIHQFITE